MVLLLLLASILIDADSTRWVKTGVKIVVVLGDNEIDSGFLTVRFLDSGLEKKILLSNLFNFFMEKRNYVSYKISTNFR